MSGDIPGKGTCSIGKNVCADGSPALLDVIHLLDPFQLVVDPGFSDGQAAESVIVISRVFIAQSDNHFEARSRNARDPPPGVPNGVQA
jgi:hypothetical protein